MASAKEVKEQRSDKKQEKNDKAILLQLAKDSGQFTSEELTRLQSDLEDESGDAYEKFQAVMSDFNKTPEGRARLRDRLGERQAERLSRKYTPFFQALLAGGDIATSIAQIKQAKNAAARLREPGMPAVPDIDPAVSGAIRDAQQGTYDQARVAGPARQEIQDTYNKDIALAKAIGGGQASTLGALGQVASMRKNRGAASLLPALDAIRARETGRLDSLIQNRGDLLDRNYRNRFYQYRSMLDNYNRDSEAIGALGSAGRANLRSSVSNLLGAVPGVVGRLGNQGYPDKYSEHEAAVNANLLGRSSTFSPYSQLGAGTYGSPISEYRINDPLADPMTEKTYRMQYRPRIY